MREPVILTGAGASRPLGFATTFEFFDEKRTGFPWRPHHPEVFEALRQELGQNSGDVEALLRILQPAEDFLSSPSGAFFTRFLPKIIGANDRWSGPISASARQVRERCFQVYSEEPDDNAVEQFFLPLLESLGWKSAVTHVFTLNYDLVLDSVLDLAKKNDVRAFDGFSYPRNLYDDRGYDDPSNTLKLYHLHGALSWVDYRGSIKNQRHCSPTGLRHIYIPPGFKGDPSREENSPPVRAAHTRFSATLSKSSTLVVIGYSFRDPHINSQIDDAMGKNPKLRLLCVDPSVPSSLDSDFARLSQKYSSRFVHIQIPFGDGDLIPALNSLV